MLRAPRRYPPTPTPTDARRFAHECGVIAVRWRGGWVCPDCFTVTEWDKSSGSMALEAKQVPLRSKLPNRAARRADDREARRGQA